MNKFKLLVIIAVLPLIIPLYAETNADDWKFDDNYRHRMIFLHSFLNYELDTNWQLDWYRERFRSSGLKVSYGSVTVKDLNSSMKAFINQELVNDWKFLAEFDHSEKQYKHEPVHANFMGFEKRLYKQFSIFSQCHPTYDKEDIDLLLGVSLMDKLSENYFRLALNYDDFLYDEKNPRGGRVTSEPLGLKWAVRIPYKRFLLASRGKVMNDSEIEFPDSSLSPNVYFERKKSDDIEIKFYYLSDKGHIAELSLYQYFYSRQERFYDELQNYKYRDKITNISIKYYHRLRENLLIKGILHYVQQESNAEGSKNYHFNRQEILPMFLLQYKKNATSWEIGYLRTDYELELDNNLADSSYQQSKNTQKYILRWTYNFSKFARLQFSVSHVPNIEGYGGGNLNLMILY